MTVCVIPTTDLRVAHLPYEERRAHERRIMRERSMADYEEGCAKARHRWRDVQAEYFLRGEPDKCPPLSQYMPIPPLYLY